MSETYREEQEANIGESLQEQLNKEEVYGEDFRSPKDDHYSERDIDWEHDRDCELENDHADENAPAEDNDPIQD